MASAKAARAVIDCVIRLSLRVCSLGSLRPLRLSAPLCVLCGYIVMDTCFRKERRGAQRDAELIVSLNADAVREARDDGSEFDAVHGFGEVQLVAFREGADAIFGACVGC